MEPHRPAIRPREPGAAPFENTRSLKQPSAVSQFWFASWSRATRLILRGARALRLLREYHLDTRPLELLEQQHLIRIMLSDTLDGDGGRVQRHAGW
jgi:hypothetical protein